jgi:hypothetical protein
MAVVRKGSLSLDAKRAILIDWAWTEYLIDQAISEGSPEIGRPSRLQKVELALRALERGNAPAGSHTPAPLQTSSRRGVSASDVLPRCRSDARPWRA